MQTAGHAAVADLSAPVVSRATRRMPRTLRAAAALSTSRRPSARCPMTTLAVSEDLPLDKRVLTASSSLCHGFVDTPTWHIRKYHPGRPMTVPVALITYPGQLIRAHVADHSQAAARGELRNFSFRYSEDPRLAHFAFVLIVRFKASSLWSPRIALLMT